MTENSYQNCVEIYKEEFVFEKKDLTIEDMIFANLCKTMLSPTDGLHGSGKSRL